MDFPNLLTLPPEHVQLVLQGYVAGLLDEKAAITELLKEMQEATDDLVEKSLYEKIFEEFRSLTEDEAVISTDSGIEFELDNE